MIVCCFNHADCK